MSKHTYSGNALYSPKGKAEEYSRWACNFFTGCSNGCNYCYCRRGPLSTLWTDRPRLKKCFKDETHALACFVKEADKHINALRADGVFFSFTTDPALPDTWPLTLAAIKEMLSREIPVQVLTKMSVPAFDQDLLSFNEKWRRMTAIGFTLTGHDELEPRADTNHQRKEAMRILHDAGFLTFSSIEPIVDFPSSMQMIRETQEFCDLYKLGLMSGITHNSKEKQEAVEAIAELKDMSQLKIYLKDSLIELIETDRKLLPKHFVTKDYNIFEL